MILITLETVAFSTLEGAAVNPLNKLITMNRIILNETSYFGAGCRSVIAVEAARRGFKKAFFVTDKDLIKFGVAAEIIFLRASSSKSHN